MKIKLSFAKDSFPKIEFEISYHIKSIIKSLFKVW